MTNSTPELENKKQQTLLEPQSLLEPKDLTDNQHFKGFTNDCCPFYPCHQIRKPEFNCLFCYCPLTPYECPGPYLVFTDRHGLKRKDCTKCNLNHEGYHSSWNFIQKWLERPKLVKI